MWYIMMVSSSSSSSSHYYCVSIWRMCTWERENSTVLSGGQKTTYRPFLSHLGFSGRHLYPLNHLTGPLPGSVRSKWAGKLCKVPNTYCWYPERSFIAFFLLLLFISALIFIYYACTWVVYTCVCLYACVCRVWQYQLSILLFAIWYFETQSLTEADTHRSARLSGSLDLSVSTHCTEITGICYHLDLLTWQ